MTTQTSEPEIERVIPVADFHPKSANFGDYLQEARDYLSFFNWHDGIREEYVGGFFEGILGLFLFRIEPKLVGVDEWVWVVVGDLPPTYLTCDTCRNPSEALGGYIGEMQEWVLAAETGQSVAELIPVNVPATPENAQILRTRLRFLNSKILPLLSNS